MIKFGVIGTNWITKMFIEAAIATKDYELVKVYSRTMAKGEQFLSSLSMSADGIDVVTTLSDLYTDIDAVYIASPNALHFEQSKAAIAAGVHVIVEKPSTSNPEEFLAIEQALSEHKDVCYFEAARHIHQPNFKIMQQTMGELSLVQGATLVYQKYSSRFDAYLAGKEPNVLTREFSGGALYDLGVYPIYAAIALFGAPQAVQYLPTLLDNGADGRGVANLFYDDFNVTVIFGKNANSYLSSEIYGLKETITTSNIAELETVTYHDGEGNADDIGERIDENPMICEAKDFADVINDPNSNYIKYSQWFQLAKQVNQTLFDLRSSAGIVFPADQKEN
ncbi:Gfo/Idh/MocA family protein [Leuconostoc palmae]|uniref:Gfo/Idh/MocA family protein n=1 Tax=Leuconostoc palmae TaxID=501487 RepID=UPI001C7D3296|nr:Gfo/Idh/MocA family oxidoreductase [Leuconostoc palmae]